MFLVKNITKYMIVWISKLKEKGFLRPILSDMRGIMAHDIANPKKYIEPGIAKVVLSTQVRFNF